MTSGYYRFPTIQNGTVVFVSEDDLWSVPVEGGAARRLTSNLGEVTYPMLSPNGELLAFVGREEGAAEVYVMPAAGGSARRLTYLSSNPRVVGWLPDSSAIIFTSSYGQPDSSEMVLFTVGAGESNGEVSNSEVKQLPYGAARSIAFAPGEEIGGRVVIGRNTGDPARWKRYRGGTAGYLWIDANGDGNFVRFLPELKGNIASPMWLADRSGNGNPANQNLGRVYFVSDHEGVGNLYSSRPDGSDLRRHTDHEDYYVRNPHSDGERIVYHAGADLFIYRLDEDTSSRVEVSYHSPRVQRNRKFVDAGRYLDGYGLHPTGQAVAVTTRGKSYTFYNHEGPVVQYGKRDGVRYRQPTWLHDGRRMLVVSDEPGEETLEVYNGKPNQSPLRLEGLEIGRVVSIKASPIEDKVALTNHRHELLLIDLTTRTFEVIDRSTFVNISGFDWSPDGRWLAYSFGATSRTSEIRLYQLPEAAAKGGNDKANGKTEGGKTEDNKGRDAGPEGQPADAASAASTATNGTARALGALPLTTRDQRHVITRPVLHDVRPAFDPEGRYLYFLSYREFNPVYDGLHFDLGFPWGMRPYLITLRADLPNPFIPVPDLGDEEEDDEHDEALDDADGDEDGAEGDDEEHDEDDHDDDDHDDEDDSGEDDDEYEDDEDDDDEPEDASDFWRALARMRRVSRSISLESEPVSSGAAKQAADAKKKGPEKQAHQPKKGEPSKPKPVRIDLDGIEQRVIAFPVSDGRYGQIIGLPNKALFTSFPIQGQLDGGYEREDDASEAGSLRAYDFKEYRSETLADNVTSFEVAANLKKLIYWGKGQLRVINAGEKAPGGGGSSRKTGWINLGRVKVSVEPQSEWEQMFREAWRLQRDQFWTEDMSEVDWQTVYHRYFALIPRVSTRGEFSDLMWEMQGELGTSHAYEFGGDYRARPFYGQGFLGTELSWDAETGGYRVGELVLGDAWDASTNSPLAAPGVDVKPDDVIIAINGQMLDAQTTPAQLLVNQAGNEVLLTLLARPKASLNGQDAPAPVAKELQGEPQDEAHEEKAQALEAAEPERAEPEIVVPDAAPPIGGAPTSPAVRTVVVKAIGSEAPARYRHWVNENRRKVHAATQGRVGYVHIPDMSAEGYAEFHRGYLAEVDRDALIIDVRYNGGGHVSQLILEKLARRRLGYDLSRWGGLIPYPVESVAGPLVALTNEHAGSDGDIFCHSFKMLKLGPLVGKRTWGGVIGISPSHPLVDGTVTTQPEYSFWFEDVGWEVENYGTDPDIDVDITPQDYQKGSDPQLDRAIQEAQHLLETQPRKVPELTTKPSRALPKLPPRVPSA
ncbi:MAG: PDZ domain-containing protein [Caldilineaceae bacterium]|nr:PDZ domain-containing protein [Caldilineaceae bacterium]